MRRGARVRARLRPCRGPRGRRLVGGPATACGRATTWTTCCTCCVSSRVRPVCSGWCRWPRTSSSSFGSTACTPGLLLSDATAAYDSPLARQVLAHLDVPMPDGEGVDDMEPAGDLELLSDLGVSADRDVGGVRTTSTSTPRTSSACSPSSWVSPSSSTRPSHWSPDDPRSAAASPEPRSGTIVDVSDDVAAMRLALAEAAPRRDTGDVPIGAVVVAVDGTVWRRHTTNARRRTTRPLTPRCSPCGPPRRARIVATRRAQPSSSPLSRARCALAPLCSSRVARVVFGAWNDEMGAAGTLWDVLRDRRLNHRPEVVSGVLGRGVVRPCWRSSSPRQRDSRVTSRGPVRYPAVACPSGRRSTPRKRVRGQLLRGFKSHRHRQPGIHRLEQLARQAHRRHRTGPVRRVALLVREPSRH